MTTIWRFTRRSFLRFAAAGAGGVALAAAGIRVLWRRCPVCGVRAGTHLFRSARLAASYCGSCGVNVEHQRWDLEDVERTTALVALHGAIVPSDSDPHAGVRLRVLHTGRP